MTRVRPGDSAQTQKQIPFGFAKSRSFAPLTPIALLCDRGPQCAGSQDDKPKCKDKNNHRSSSASLERTGSVQEAIGRCSSHSKRAKGTAAV
jgi:hypothetical protein